MIRDLHVVRTEPLFSPRELERELPLTAAANKTVHHARQTLRLMASGHDRRLLLLIGPCSIHNVVAALEYARRLVALAPKVSDRIFMVMRCFFEKPRSITGWPGSLCDPYLDGSNDGGEGLRRARHLLLEINGMGLPAATEVIDPIASQYLAELLSLATVGARTSESSTQRRLASGLSAPVAIKNGTDGDLQGAINAMLSVAYPSSFFGIDRLGSSAVVHTTGNRDSLLVLRGGRDGPNFDAENILAAAARLQAVQLCDRVVVDTNHAQSGGVPERQAAIWRSVVDDLPRTGQNVLGLQIESFLEQGKQTLDVQKSQQDLQYGLSVTDACLGWDETEQLIFETYAKLA